MPLPRKRKLPKPSKRGAQPGNTNALTHGAYAAPLKPIESIEDVIADVQTKQARLSAILDEILLGGDYVGDLENITKLFALHGQNASRLGRLLRDQRALSGASANGITEAIAAAIAERSTELGVEF